jgi:hypothetical protein
VVRSGVAVVLGQAVLACSPNGASGPSSGQLVTVSPGPLGAEQTSPPTLAILSVRDGEVVSEDTLNVTGTAPPNAVITRVIPLTPDAQTRTDEYGVWSISVVLPLGATELTFRIGDDERTAVSITVTRVPSTPVPSQTSNPTPRPPPAWYPAGYTLIDATVVNPDWPVFAYRWLTRKEIRTKNLCPYSACLAMYVIPRDGCSTLYMELSTVDASGTVVGFTNDSVVGVGPGEKARLVFTITDPGATGARFNSISCY